MFTPDKEAKGETPKSTIKYSTENIDNHSNPGAPLWCVGLAVGAGALGCTVLGDAGGALPVGVLCFLFCACVLPLTVRMICSS